ncbi:hypothetical protein HK104_003011 [Borealophlyctis nickersoniae]|nr:hypothetical protein HK104_003011 [Borealophlyctis nickersoniae]
MATTLPRPPSRQGDEEAPVAPANENTPLLSGAGASVSVTNTVDGPVVAVSRPQRLVYLDQIRGTLMILQSIDPFAFYVTTVLFALGVNIFFGAVILALEQTSTDRLTAALSRLGPERARRDAVLFSLTAYLLSAIVITSLASIYTPTPEHSHDPISWWFKVFFLPTPLDGSSKFVSMYAPIPWLGMVIWGLMIQRANTEFKLKARTNGVLHAILAVCLLLIFVVVRLVGGFGNINPDYLHPPPRESIINFFNLTKYPPSVAYTTCMLGLVHALAALYIFLELRFKNTSWTSERAPLLVYGRSAFFFYVAHFYVYQAMRAIFTWFGWTGPFGGWTGGQQDNLPDGWFWVSWLAGLAILYVACAKYGRFKAGTSPDSLWRLF